MRNPEAYDGTPICPRCGDGWPVCADTSPTGEKYTHAETCARYEWADDLCPPCDEEMESYYGY